MFNPQNPNNMASERTYIGNGKQKAGSEYIRLSICVDDLLQAAHAESVEHTNGKHYLTVIVARKRTTEHGNSHTAYVPHQVDAKELEYGQVADQQEMEVLSYYEREA